MEKRVIFHVDANSAFLSWTAAYRVKVLEETVDLREIPSVVEGDKEKRQGIILAKSTPAKKFGIQTGEPLFRATFRGWKYGPVLKELREPYQNQELLPTVKEKDAAAKAPVMDRVFSDYAPKDSMSLSRLTHGEISWKRSRKGVTPAENSDKPISLGDIRLDAQRIRDRREKLSQQGLL